MAERFRARSRRLAGTLSLGAALLASACSDGSSGSGEVTVDLSKDPIVIRTEVARAEVTRSQLRLTLRESATGRLLTREHEEGGMFYERGGETHFLGEVLSAEAAGDGVALTAGTEDGGAAAVRLRFLTPRTLEVVLEPSEPMTIEAVGAIWDTPDDELIYGLTERLRDAPPFAPGAVDIPVDDIRPQEVGSLNRRGETIEMFIRPTFSLYTPFYQSSRGYGVAVAGTMPGSYDVAGSLPNALRFRFETGTVPENRELRFYVFAGPEFATILDEYTRLTGRPLIPPDWAFLNWRWRDELAIGAPGELDGVEVNAQVAEDVKMFEAFGIPPGVYLLDRPVLAGNFGFARFEWDEERLPNPRAMLDALRRRGYRIATWSATWVCGNDPGDNGFEAQQLGFIAPMTPPGPPFCANVNGRSFILDVTHPDARDWFAQRLASFVSAEGIDAIKLDRGEEHIPSAADDVWADGRNGREVHNDYVVLQTKLHRDALDAVHSDGDFVLITRSGYSGTQRDSIVWGGDITGSESFGAGPGTDLGLRSAIISQQRAAFMGFPIWGSDTGGYYQFKDRDVFARWIEFSAFSGIMEIGGTGTHAPWDMPTDPSFDEEMIEIYRRYTRLREDMLDYIVATAHAAETGMPMVRPLAFLDRQDPELQDRWDQYLFGPDLMVAPIWRVGQRQRDVYFPPGRWRSLWNEEARYEGPATVSFEVPLDTIPVFIRGDAESPLP